MKKLSLLLTALLLINLNAVQAQKSVKEKDIIGKWKLVIEIEEAMEEAEQEIREEDSWFAQAIFGSVSGLVTGIIGELDIYMEFQKGGDLTIYVEAFDEREVEKSQWSIRDGKLYIEDTDSFQTDNNNYWLMSDGILVSMDDDDRDNRPYVYMVSLEK